MTRIDTSGTPQQPQPASGVAAHSSDPLAPYDAVLILSYGGPTGPDDVLPFMRNATAGRGVPDERLLEVSGHYGRFGGVSPINARNAELCDALRAELARRGSCVPLLLGNRNWHPFVSQALRELADGGARRILAMTTAAYASYSGCRQYREDVAGALKLLAAGADGSTGRGREADAAARVGGVGGAPVTLTVDKTRPFYNTEGMCQANVDAVVEAYRGLTAQGIAAQDIRLVFVTHSIPQGMEDASAAQPIAREEEGIDVVVEPGMSADGETEISYVTQHRLLISHLVPTLTERLGLHEPPVHDLVYCSRSGPPQARWLEPDINDHLEALAAGRLTDGSVVDVPAGVVIAPIGFVADHMEVVFDLDTEARATAANCGLPYVRAATAGTHPAFISSLVDLLCERAAVSRGEDVIPQSTTGTGPFHTVCPPTCCRPGSRPHRPSAHSTHNTKDHTMTEHPLPPHAATDPAPHPHAAAPRAGHPQAAAPHGVATHAVAPHGAPVPPPTPSAAPSGEGGEHHYRHDPRDERHVDIEAVNNSLHYALYAVFRLTQPLPPLEDTRRRLVGESQHYVDLSEVTTRGWYDVSGFRSDADLMVWWIDDDPEKLQDANHRLRASALGRYLEPVWSCMGLHTPAEFNRMHIPACFGGVTPRDWLMVYPFVRSYDWYLLDPAERSRIMKEHGRNGFSQYPDVKGSTLSTMGLSDYEWILGFEADTLDRLEGVIHHQRYTEARLYVREDTPFYTGVRVSPAEWAERQPRA